MVNSRTGGKMLFLCVIPNINNNFLMFFMQQGGLDHRLDLVGGSELAKANDRKGLPMLH